MELTKQQIQKVAHYLKSKNLEYVDLQPEVLDHIVTEIEEKMEVEKVTFHNAFATSKQKWNPQLQETTSMFFGFGFSAPKIVIQKAKKGYLKCYLGLLLSYFVPFLWLTSNNFIIKNPSENNYFILVKAVVFLCFASFLFMLFTKKQQKTTYGFILKAQSFNLFVGLILCIDFMTRISELNGIDIGMLCSFLFSTFSYFNFYKKHKTVLKKHQIS
ncbi:hypothetical protein [uncultured Polaribacter sp.]|uniref:hypothetical protein n=1 Tax=uncultured Polaribacter sp. TaxID=174711 RepID=UPI00261472F5|nr:hypothetical protein [uncultured Polaribacter sp.]